MKIQFRFEEEEPLWKGFKMSGFTHGFRWPYLDAGFISVDWYPPSKMLSFYFWKFAISIKMK